MSTCTRPYIDELTRVNPDDPTGKSHMHRITDVMDCWFESGSMSFAQYHYPFENKETFEQHFPCDYIVNTSARPVAVLRAAHHGDRTVRQAGVQERDLAMASCSVPMVRRCRSICATTPDVNGVFNDFGSDAMRWFLMSSPILRGGNLIVTRRWHSRHRASGHAASVEFVLLLHPVCERRQ